MFSRIAVIAAAAVACTVANGSELSQRRAPRLPNSNGVLAGDRVAIDAVGPDLVVTIPWIPNETDSVRFTASLLGTEVASSSPSAPYAPPEVFVVGARPLPGVSVTYDLAIGGTYVDRAVRTPFSGSVGSVTWTEPQPAGSGPTTGTPSIDSTPGSGPQASRVEVLPDSVSVLSFETVQFCGFIELDNGTMVQRTREIGIVECDLFALAIADVPNAIEQAVADSVCLDWTVTGGTIVGESCGAMGLEPSTLPSNIPTIRVVEGWRDPFTGELHEYRVEDLIASR